MICTNCVNFEPFGIKGIKEFSGFFNKCALLDYWNLEECDHCGYYERMVEYTGTELRFVPDELEPIECRIF